MVSHLKIIYACFLVVYCNNCEREAFIRIILKYDNLVYILLKTLSRNFASNNLHFLIVWNIPLLKVMKSVIKSQSIQCMKHNQLKVWGG